jgi:hypothetical protein
MWISDTLFNIYYCPSLIPPLQVATAEPSSTWFPRRLKFKDKEGQLYWDHHKEDFFQYIAHNVESIYGLWHCYPEVWGPILQRA